MILVNRKCILSLKILFMLSMKLKSRLPFPQDMVNKHTKVTLLSYHPALRTQLSEIMLEA